MPYRACVVGNRKENRLRDETGSSCAFAFVNQGLQGSHLNLSQTSASTYFLLNNKAVNDVIRE